MKYPIIVVLLFSLTVSAGEHVDHVNREAVRNNAIKELEQKQRELAVTGETIQEQIKRAEERAREVANMEEGQQKRLEEEKVKEQEKQIEENKEKMLELAGTTQTALDALKRLDPLTEAGLTPEQASNWDKAVDDANKVFTDIDNKLTTLTEKLALEFSGVSAEGQQVAAAAMLEKVKSISGWQKVKASVERFVKEAILLKLAKDPVKVERLKARIDELNSQLGRTKSPNATSLTAVLVQARDALGSAEMNVENLQTIASATVLAIEENRAALPAVEVAQRVLAELGAEAQADGTVRQLSQAEMTSATGEVVETRKAEEVADLLGEGGDVPVQQEPVKPVTQPVETIKSDYPKLTPNEENSFALYVGRGPASIDRNVTLSPRQLKEAGLASYYDPALTTKIAPDVVLQEWKSYLKKMYADRAMAVLSQEGGPQRVWDQFVEKIGKDYAAKAQGRTDFVWSSVN
jgi:hypothetical protein